MEHRNAPSGPTGLQLFISHAGEDEQLACLVTELIAKALHLPAAAIRCTSVDGYRLPAGARTDEQLRREVEDSAAFIGIISQSSLCSVYVLFELGARWGTGKTLIPLIAPGLAPGSLVAPLSSLNALRADSRAHLHQLVDDISKALAVNPQSPAVYLEALERVLQVEPVTSAEPSTPAPIVDQVARRRADADTNLRVLQEQLEIIVHWCRAVASDSNVTDHERLVQKVEHYAMTFLRSDKWADLRKHIDLTDKHYKHDVGRDRSGKERMLEMADYLERLIGDLGSEHVKGNPSSFIEF